MFGAAAHIILFAGGIDKKELETEGECQAEVQQLAPFGSAKAV